MYFLLLISSNLILSPTVRAKFFDIHRRRPLKVSGVYSRELKLIIQFAYLRKCDVGEDTQNVLELLKAAIYLGITELKLLCEEILINTLNMITSVELIKSDLG